MRGSNESGSRREDEGEGKSKTSAIELSDSDTEEEEDVSRSAEGKEAVERGERSGPEGSSTVKSAPESILSTLGDRAQMEQERLERQRKRQREQGVAGEDNRQEQRATKRAAIEQTSKGNTSLPELGASEPALYWNGTVKKSYNQFSQTTPGTPFARFLLPTTPLNAAGLTHAVIASYCADLPWMSRLFPKASAQQGPEITFICLEEKELKAGVHSPMHPSLPNWVQLVVPRRGLSEYVTMHMKFIMLFYKDRMRLMILSGNMVEYDWQLIENTAFIHDFPRLPKGQRDTSSEYSRQMRAVLSSLSVPASHPAAKVMSSYDMQSTCEARIVASVPTPKPLKGWAEMEAYGLARLARTVQDILGSRGGGGVTVEAQGSSMGSYSSRWIQQFHIISSAIDYKSTLPLPPAAKANKAWAQAVLRKESEKWPPVKLLFPSDRWVKTQSVQGPSGALTFFGKSKQSVEKGFIDILYQPVSVRGSFMMHHKAILALQPGAEEEEEAEKVVGWAYMGSHNLTQAAWGNISQPKAGADPQCTIGNWELGIVMPLRKRDLDESQRKAESSRLAANIITWQRPVEKYRLGDVPWDQFNQPS